MVEKVNNWLDQQEGKFSGDRPSQVNMLQQNLDFGALEIQELYAGEKLIVVPVRTGFVTETNKQLNPVQYALFILDAKQSIRKGNIVQFVADATYPSKNLPANFFHNYYNLKEISISGKIAFLNVAGDFQYETKYDKGKLVHHTVLEYKKRGSTSGPAIEAECYDVWLIQIFPDGSYQIIQFLYSFCIGGTGGGGNGEQPCRGTVNVSGRGLQVECGGGGSGPGGGATFAVTKLMTWEAYREVMANAPALIFAQIQLWGVRDSNEPQGGHFTNAFSHDTYTENFSTYGMSWSGSYTQAWHGTQAAYHTVQGTIDYGPYGPPPKYIYKSKTFLFAEVFP